VHKVSRMNITILPRWMLWVPIFPFATSRFIAIENTDRDTIVLIEVNRRVHIDPNMNSSRSKLSLSWSPFDLLMYVKLMHLLIKKVIQVMVMNEAKTTQYLYRSNFRSRVKTKWTMAPRMHALTSEMIVRPVMPATPKLLSVSAIYLNKF
jgi:hypothetical protein